MSQSHRLMNGGRVDRSKQIDFYFNGRLMSGYEGDTLASALLANGVMLVGRSFLAGAALVDPARDFTAEPACEG